MSETFTLPMPRRNAKFYPPMHRQRVEPPSDEAVIIGQVCRKHKVSMRELHERTGDNRANAARREIALRLSDELGMVPAAIGRLISIDAYLVANWLPHGRPGVDKTPIAIVVAVEDALAGEQHDGPAIGRAALRRIAEEVAVKHRLLSAADLRNKGRTPALVAARWEAWYRCRMETPFSLNVIGQFFGFDHASVMHGVSEYRRRMGVSL